MLKDRLASWRQSAHTATFECASKVIDGRIRDVGTWSGSGNDAQSSKKIQLIDVRSKEEYEIEHIPNAINIPLSDLNEGVKKMDKTFQFITVCGKGGGRSEEGAKQLKALGFNANWLCGGTISWMKNKLG